MSKLSHTGIVGILLAAGKGSRFDAQGKRDKLAQVLPHGDRVAVGSAKNLLTALPIVVAVVRSDEGELAAELRALGCRVSVCEGAAQGMGASLVHGVSQTQDADGWIIALADMPFVQASTIAALAAEIENGAGIAAPVCRGRRGNPVAFGRRHLPQLLTLGGDEGARRMLRSLPVSEVVVNDPGVHRDIDKPEDLPTA
jgi:molybdenum cofactor cytidylyltransferase